MLASISLDLDNKWSYLKTQGLAGWQQYPTYLPQCVPRILERLDSLQLKISFFIVGKDASLEVNRAAIGSIAQAGHELANHSFHHEPWLHLYSAEEIHQELQATEEALVNTTGVHPIGFRGPGFSYSPTLLTVLKERGYAYDCTTFPTFLGPIARAYFFFKTRLSGEEREKRKQLFGRISQGFLPLRAYRWRGTASPLVEIPVTTMPWLKVPIHMSYIMFLAEKSPGMAKTYFKLALWLCKLNRIEPSVLLHPTDFFGSDTEPDMAFFPAMKPTSQSKCELVTELFAWMQARFECCSMREHAREVAIRFPQ